MGRPHAPGLCEAPTMKAQLPVLQQKMEKFLQWLVETDNATAIEKYENEIARLEEQKILLRKKSIDAVVPWSPSRSVFEPR